MAASEPERGAISPLPEAFARWQDAAGPYWLYVCATPFLSELTVEMAAAVEPRVPTALARVVYGGRNAGTAIFADLVPEVALLATPLLQRCGYHVVPVIQRWAVAPAVIRSETLLVRLVACQPATSLPVEVRGVVFLLDRRRFGVAGPPPARPARLAVRRHPRLGRRFDNRYEYPICRFPPPDLLRENGVSRAVWLPDWIAPDLQPYAARLAAAGLAGVPAAPALSSS